MDGAPPLIDQGLGLHPALADAWDSAARWGNGTVMAVLIATYGPAYRNAGTTMAIHPDGRFSGSITSGCIEEDLILRAQYVRQTNRAQTLRYGEGSPFFDLRLPCGGAIEVLLLPLQDANVLRRIAEDRAMRRPVSLVITPDARLIRDVWRPTGHRDGGFQIGFRPPPRFLIFGTGAEAATFTALVRGMGYTHLLVSPDSASLRHAAIAGSPTHRMGPGFSADDLAVDADTAAILFFHDHDQEPAILRSLVNSPAFYIGAQGSRAAQANRLSRLRDMGVAEDSLTRIRGPVGLIPSSRDPNALAISVLAEIVGLHGEYAKPEV